MPEENILKDLNVIILAAGKGKRMHSSIPKVLHNIIDKPMIYYVMSETYKLNPKNVYVITGFGHELLEEYIKNNFQKANCIYQKEQLGTAHAVSLVKEHIKDNSNTLVLAGDCPLIESKTLKRLIASHEKQKSSCTILTAKMDNPYGYGRVIKNKLHEVIKIVEESDASKEEKLINEINTSIYCFDSIQLFNNIDFIKAQNNQGEYYLTDIIERFVSNNLKVSNMLVENNNEVLGVNDRIQLAIAEKLMRKKINERIMSEGVTITDPNSTFISCEANIENDVIIQPFSFIFGKSTIKKNCIIGPFAQIYDSEIQENTVINSAVIKNAIIGKNNNIGPFSYIRPETVTNSNVKIGGFCEVKKSVIGKNSKIPHLSYVGDSEIGENVNIGASSVTCNYDGYKKNKTIIGNNVFIGSDTMLVPPVKIGDGVIVAAGSVITEDIPDNAMAISRGRQINKIDGAKKYREKKENLK